MLSHFKVFGNFKSLAAAVGTSAVGAPTSSGERAVRVWHQRSLRGDRARGLRWRRNSTVCLVGLCLLAAKAVWSQPIELVVDLVPGGFGSAPQKLVDVRGVLYFIAEGPAGEGFALHRTDGTAAGTAFVDDLDDPDISGNYEELTRAGGQLFFRARTNVQTPVDSELWVSRGDDIQLVRDILPDGLGGVPIFLTEVGGLLFFLASGENPDGSDQGYELWRSDGTFDGTHLVEEINPGFAGIWDANVGFSRVVRFEAGEPVLYFIANSPALDPQDVDSAGGFELWRSDGTAAGTELAADLNLGFNGSTPLSTTPLGLTIVGDDLLFSCTAPGPGRELCRYNDVGAGFVADIAPAGASSFPRDLVAVGDVLFFTADDGVHGRELWRWSAADGALMVADLTTGPGSSTFEELTAFEGRLFFVFDDGDDANGEELWASDGTAGGTAVVRDIAVGVDSANRAYDSSPRELTKLGRYLYFSAWTPTAGREVWRSDGSESGTVLVEDLWPGTGSSDPKHFGQSGGTLYFNATNPTAWIELHRIGPPPVVVSDGFESGDFAGWSAAFP